MHNKLGCNNAVSNEESWQVNKKLHVILEKVDQATSSQGTAIIVIYAVSLKIWEYAHSMLQHIYVLAYSSAWKHEEDGFK